MPDLAFVYLVQGEAVLLSGLRFPAGACVFALCYDEDVEIHYAEQTLFDPNCSWTVGRNKLLSLALTNYPDADYYVFCDDDIEFIRGSFEQFEGMVAQTRPAVAVPVVPKIAHLVMAELDVQRALGLDEQMVALHRSVVGISGIAPLVSAYDETSWYIACLIFEYNVLKFYDIYCHQYNNIVIENTEHRQESTKSSYKAGNFDSNELVLKDYIKEEFGYYDITVIDIYYGLESRDAVARRIYPVIQAEILRSASIIAPIAGNGSTSLRAGLVRP